MRVIMFQPRFVGAVELGHKSQTIRKRANCKPGDDLSLRTWQGKPYRSKHRSIGAGRVLSVECEQMDEDWSLQANGVATRWLPCPGAPRLVRPSQPYWSSVGRVQCAEPGTLIKQIG